MMILKNKSPMVTLGVCWNTDSLLGKLRSKKRFKHVSCLSWKD